MKLRALTVAALVFVAGMSAGQAQAAPIYGASVFATGGHVIATFESNGAGYSNDLYLESPANGLGLIFNNWSSAPGSTVDLGEFAPGTELIFKVHVQNTGDNFFTGPGVRNTDGIAHVLVDNDVVGYPGKTLVGFEDLLWGGDYDYNDLVFSFTNVQGANERQSVPEPTSLLLLGTGLALGARQLRRRLKTAR